MTRRKPENNHPSPRNLEIYAAVLSGDPPAEIAKKHGVSRPRIHVIAERVRAWFRPQLAGEIAEIRKKQTELLTCLFNEAMDGWERSKLDVEKKRTKTVGSGRNKKTETTVVVEGQAGDPRFLQEAQRCLEGIRKIWGADMPIKVDVEGTIEEVQVVELVVSSREELAEFRTATDFARKLMLDAEGKDEDRPGPDVSEASGLPPVERVD